MEYVCESLTVYVHQGCKCWWLKNFAALHCSFPKVNTTSNESLSIQPANSLGIHNPFMERHSLKLQLKSKNPQTIICPFHVVLFHVVDRKCMLIQRMLHAGPRTVPVLPPIFLNKRSETRTPQQGERNKRKTRRTFQSSPMELDFMSTVRCLLVSGELPSLHMKLVYETNYVG